MPRWRALPEELDPQVREFAGQLRRQVERSGLSISALADRTGYSKTSWERYLNGRLLPPQRAVVALAEVTGAHTGHLTTMWELAERAWSRSEMRHDVTMEAIRVAQARAALGEFGPAPDEPKGGLGDLGKRSVAAAPAAPAPEAPPLDVPEAPAAGEVPDAPGAPEAPTAPRLPHQRGGGSPALGAHPAPSIPPTPAPPVSPPTAPPTAPPAAGPDPERRRRITMFVTGVVGALLLIAAAVLLLGGGDGGQRAEPAPAPTHSQAPDLPAGVKCSGAGCTGKDPEEMGCGGTHATTPSRGVMGGALIEVRYSKVCGTAWARLTGGAQGDRATVTSGGRTEEAKAGRDGSAYTAMVQVSGAPEKVRACGTTNAGYQSCTEPEAAPATGSAPATAS
ncbi:helix-turn-helix domain-containing protein [Streptomyces ochraceiscleroticus]|uniref:DUF2690 domain-containing protein n=1 Tax=Streptomyces ochraceiscleroticus TaxID=47761 RepID=A0ABW1MH57_9ACTN|nr:XRE family transcriptional regulator [Streptomyces ochraceiscleroticus]